MEGPRRVRIGARKRRIDGNRRENGLALVWGLVTQEARMELEKP